MIDVIERDAAETMTMTGIRFHSFDANYGERPFKCFSVRRVFVDNMVNRSSFLVMVLRVEPTNH